MSSEDPRCAVCGRLKSEHPNMGNCGKCGQPLVETTPFAWTCPPCVQESLKPENRIPPRRPGS